MTAIPSAKLVSIFGGSGFIGRHIVRVLARDGWRIRVGVRRPNAANFLRPMGRVGQIQIVRANLRKSDDCAMMLRDADAAINLVGILYERGAQRFQDSNFAAPLENGHNQRVNDSQRGYRQRQAPKNAQK